MNDAAEAAIRWRLSQETDIEDHVEGFVEALKEGCLLGEADALQYRDRLLASALDAAKGGAAEAYINNAVALHLEIEKTKETARQLDHLEAIAGIVEKMKPGPFGERVAASKLKDLIDKL